MTSLTCGVSVTVARRRSGTRNKTHKAVPREVPAEFADAVERNFAYTALLRRTATTPKYSGSVTLFEARCHKPIRGFVARWARIHNAELVVHPVDSITAGY